MMRIDTQLQHQTAYDMRQCSKLLQDISEEVLTCAIRLEKANTVFERTSEQLIDYRWNIELAASFSSQLGILLDNVAGKYEVCERRAILQAEFRPDLWFAEHFHRPSGIIEMPYRPRGVLFIRPAALLRTMWVTEYPAHEPLMFHLLTDGMWPVEPQGRIDPNQLQHLFEENIFTMLR